MVAGRFLTYILQRCPGCAGRAAATIQFRAHPVSQISGMCPFDLAREIRRIRD